MHTALHVAYHICLILCGLRLGVYFSIVQIDYILVRGKNMFHLGITLLSIARGEYLSNTKLHVKCTFTLLTPVVVS